MKRYWPKEMLTGMCVLVSLMDSTTVDVYVEREDGFPSSRIEACGLGLVGVFPGWCMGTGLVPPGDVDEDGHYAVFAAREGKGLPVIVVELAGAARLFEPRPVAVDLDAVVETLEEEDFLETLGLSRGDCPLDDAELAGAVYRAVKRYRDHVGAAMADVRHDCCSSALEEALALREARGVVQCRS